MSELLEAGLTITGIGLGVVFILLTLMVGVVLAMSRLSALLEGPQPPAAAAGGTPAAETDELVGVIGAAVAAYRKRRRG